MNPALIARMMAEHDRGHAEELAELLEEIAADLPVLAALRARANDSEHSAHLATA